MRRFVEFVVYLFFLAPTFMAFYMMFKCILEKDNEDWYK